MKEHRTALDPTGAILSEILLVRADEITPVDALWIAHMPAPIQRGRKAVLRAIHHAGVRIVPGTDDNAIESAANECALREPSGSSPAR